jgi:thiol-disulfide isomerase/thioredoxin
VEQTVSWYQVPSGVLDEKAAAAMELENYVAEHETLPPGTAAPEIEFTALNSAKKMKLSDLRGKVVVLDFWATWCGPCKVEIPWFIELERQYKDQGFAVLGVSMDEDGWVAIKPYVQKMQMNYRVLLGNDDVSTAYGGLDSLPTTLLIDRQGKIASVHVGVSMGKEEFKNAIVQLLNAPHDRAAASGGALALLTRPGAR